MKEHFEQLVRYEKWANKIILDALKELPVPDEKCVDIMAHLLLAEKVWYSRMAYQNPPPVWDKKTLNECYQLYEENNKTLDAFVSRLAEIDFFRVVEYKNSKGIRFENTIKDILTHTFNHSTYHRGQIAERLKGKLPKMPVTDFIAFLRE